jgi:hypothetical protein
MAGIEQAPEGERQKSECVMSMGQPAEDRVHHGTVAGKPLAVAAVVFACGVHGFTLAGEAALIGQQISCVLSVPTREGAMPLHVRAEMMAKSGMPLSCGNFGIKTDAEFTRSGFEFLHARPTTSSTEDGDSTVKQFDVVYEKRSIEPLPGIKLMEPHVGKRTMLVVADRHIVGT